MWTRLASAFAAFSASSSFDSFFSCGLLPPDFSFSGSGRPRKPRTSASEDPFRSIICSAIASLMPRSASAALTSGGSPSSASASSDFFSSFLAWSFSSFLRRSSSYDLPILKNAYLLSLENVARSPRSNEYCLSPSTCLM